MAGKAFGHDYRMEWVEEERGSEKSSTVNWIYIGTDTQRPTMAKIGLTTSSLGTRASGSQNPFYTIYCAFKIKSVVDSRKVSEIEDALKKSLSKQYKCIPHKTTGRQSEWFEVAPKEMRIYAEHFLCVNFHSEMLCYFCHSREVYVVDFWENNEVIYDSPREPYQVKDRPVIDPNCYMPGGCGADCNCWD